MATELFTLNEASTTVSSGGTTAPAQGTAETWTVASSASFPAAATGVSQFHVADPASSATAAEIITVTNVSGTTWTVTRGAESTTPVAHTAGFTVQQVITAGALATFVQNPMTSSGDTMYGGTSGAASRLAGDTSNTRKFLRAQSSGGVAQAPAWDTLQAGDVAAIYPWQFLPESYGAKGDARMLYDVSMNGTTAVLTTAGLPAPSSWPAGSQITGSASGGSLAAGVYQVKTAYVNQSGETLPSSAASYTASGSASSIVANSPAPWTNATGFNVYCTVAGGSTFFKQNTNPVALRSAYTITAVTTGTATPPGANTSNSAPFTAGDVGKVIIVPSAGGFLNVPLVSVIASYQSPTQVTLANVSSRAVSGQGAVYGSDDTAAVQAAINAAVAYGQTAGTEPDASVDVVLNSVYCIAGVPGGTNMSGQLQLPYVDPYAGPKVHLRFVMPQPAPGPVHWEQPNPPMPRGTLVSVYYNDSSAGFGPPPNVILGGPVTGFGQNGGKFSNMRVSGDLNFLAAYRSAISGLDLYGVSQAAMNSVGHFCMAATGTAAGGWPPYVSGTGNPSTWQTFTYRTPTTGNNALNYCGRVTAYGPYHAVIYTDHFTAAEVTAIYVFFGATAAPSSAPAHHCSIQSLICEASGYGLYWDNSGTYSGGGSQAVFVASLAAEGLAALINDPGNYAQGEVHAESQSSTGQVATGKLAGGGANIKLVWSNQALGAITAPGVPSSGTAFTNTFWQRATIQVTGGTVSQIAIDGVNTGLTSGLFPLRNGGTITLTYSVAPTWKWWLG